MLDLTGVKNIIFDLGGVILNIDYLLASKAFVELGIENFDAVYSQAKQNHVFDKFETGSISPVEFRNYLIDIEPSLSAKKIDGAWNAMLLDLPKNRVDLLHKLKDEFRIFLLSNTNEIHIAAFNKIVKENYSENLFDDLFENHYYSSRIGLRKPNLDCFEYILSKNNLKAEETLFIDDSSQHIEGAKLVGLQTCFLEEGMDIVNLFPGTIQ